MLAQYSKVQHSTAQLRAFQLITVTCSMLPPNCKAQHSMPIAVSTQTAQLPQRVAGYVKSKEDAVQEYAPQDDCVIILGELCLSCKTR